MPEKRPLGRKLFSRAQKGDIPAFEVLVEGYRDTLYSIALQLSRSETDALQIVQESFFSAYRHLNEFPTEAEFRAWIHWIAASQALNGAPLPESPDSLLKRDVAQRLTVDCADDGREDSLSPQLQGAIEETMENLPQSQREVLLLKDVAGLDYDQIASITGNLIANIKAHLNQARLTICKRIASLPV